MSSRVPTTYVAIQRVLRLAVSAFFRDVEVEGVPRIPDDRCGLIVSWHPNGLVDPGLILTQFPHQVVFGARHGLFRYPVLGTLLRRIGTVPIYRARDLGQMSEENRRAANRKSLDALAAEIARGSYSALFPEGVSHDEPFLKGLKTGAARLYYRARQLQPEGAPPPVILPVGLHYDDKQMFRSNAMVTFHPPLQLPPELDVTPELGVEHEQVRALARKLTDHIEAVLREVVHATDDWALYEAMHRTRRMVRAERAHRADADPGRTTISERVLGFARVRAGYYTMMAKRPDDVRRLVAQVQDYDRDLRALGLQDYDLDRDAVSATAAGLGWLAIRATVVFLFLPLLVVYGYLVNLPTALGLRGLAKLASRHRKDEATVKLVVGIVVFPLTWWFVGFLVWRNHAAASALVEGLPDSPVIAGLLASGLAALGGVLGVRYLPIASETARAVRARITRRRRRLAIARLRRQRAKLTDAVVTLAEGVQLPGRVADDGRIVGDDPSR